MCKVRLLKLEIEYVIFVAIKVISDMCKLCALFEITWVVT